jgi:hypothetical protein
MRIITHNHLVIFSDSCSDQNKNSEKKKPTARLKVSTAEEDNALLQHLEQNPFHIMRHAAQETNLPGSRFTACRRIKSSYVRRSSKRNSVQHGRGAGKNLQKTT